MLAIWQVEDSIKSIYHKQRKETAEAGLEIWVAYHQQQNETAEAGLL